MKRFMCCVKGGSSSNNGENDDIDYERLYGNNEQLNNEWRNYIKQREDRHPQALSPESRSLFRYGTTFQWREIFYGTLNLRNNNILGRGNFGEVYRCNFPRINKVGAVKIQNPYNAEAYYEFAAEIKTLHAANHPNVINLLGKCLDEEHRAIVYEFMPRGSLDRHIYANAKPQSLQLEYAVLDWHKRLKIAIGVANALIYVHEQLKTIHRDVKLANVLLDEGFVPKLTDFGLATKIVEDKNGVEKQSIIRLIKGTQGCIAPETEGCGLASSKSDVYSYGVFLLTLFTGMKAYDPERPDGAKKLTERLRNVWDRNDYIPLVVDYALGNRYSVQGLHRLFLAARMCMDLHEIARPNMRVVETMVRQAANFEVPEFAPVMPRHSI